MTDPTWPARLRAARTAARLSLRQLAARTHYSHGYLHDLEVGRKPPTPETAARLAAVLGEHLEQADGDDRLDHAAAHPHRVDAATVDTLATLLAGLRRLEDTAGAQAALPQVLSGLDLLGRLVDHAAGPVRPSLVDVAAQWAQHAGWLQIATGRWSGVRHWHAQGLEWATEARNQDLCAVILSFRGYGAELSGQHGAAAGLTRAALGQPGIYIAEAAYDHHQLARALARTGDPAGAVSMLAAGRDLAAQALADPGEVPPWHYYRSEPFFELEAGAVYLALGEQDRRWAHQAVEHLGSGLEQLAATGQAPQWTDLYRQRLARALELSANS